MRGGIKTSNFIDNINIFTVSIVLEPQYNTLKTQNHTTIKNLDIQRADTFGVHCLAAGSHYTTESFVMRY